MEPIRRYRPQGATEIRNDAADAVVYFYNRPDSEGVLEPFAAAIAYSGKHTKPDWHSFFETDESRQEAVEQYFANLIRRRSDEF